MHRLHAFETAASKMKDSLVPPSGSKAVQVVTLSRTINTCTNIPTHGCHTYSANRPHRDLNDLAARSFHNVLTVPVDLLFCANTLCISATSSSVWI